MNQWLCRMSLLILAGCGGGSVYSGAVAYTPEPVYADDQSVRQEIYGSGAGASVGLTEGRVAPSVTRSVELTSATSMAPPAPPESGSSFEASETSGPVVRERYADATPEVVQPVAGTQRATGDESARIVDAAQRGPLLIYTATIHLSVFEVERTQASIIEAVRAVNGFVQLQNDRQLTVRVPVGEFRTVLPQIEQLGDVLHRNVEALDVSDEYRDLGVRLQNAIAVRDRLQLLLAAAQNTEQALNVERELERVTLVIEQIRGRMQLLGDRIAYSTVTVMFQAHAVVSDQPGAFRLPVPWLDELTLSRLLTLPNED